MHTLALAYPNARQLKQPKHSLGILPLLSALLLGICIAGCSKSQNKHAAEPPKPQGPYLAGTWRVDSLRVDSATWAVASPAERKRIQPLLSDIEKYGYFDLRADCTYAIHFIHNNRQMGTWRAAADSSYLLLSDLIFLRKPGLPTEQRSDTLFIRQIANKKALLSLMLYSPDSRGPELWLYLRNDTTPAPEKK